MSEITAHGTCRHCHLPKQLVGHGALCQDCLDILTKPRGIPPLEGLGIQREGTAYSLPSHLMPSVHPSQLHQRPAFTEVAVNVEPGGTPDEVREFTADLMAKIAERREQVLAAAWFLQRPDMVDRLFYFESPIRFASQMDVNRHAYRVVAELDVMVASRWEPPGDPASTA